MVSQLLGLLQWGKDEWNVAVANVARGLTGHDAFDIRSEVIDHIHRVDQAVHAGLSGALYFCEVLSHQDLGRQVSRAEICGRTRLVLWQAITHHGGIIRHCFLWGRTSEDDAGIKVRDPSSDGGFGNRGSVQADLCWIQV